MRAGRPFEDFVTARTRPLLLAAFLTAIGCGGDTDRTTVTVLAASSLTDAFTDVGERFEAAHPGYDVRLGFAASSDLARQVLEGAPADVYASADPDQVDRLVAAGITAEPPTIFARNTLAIAVAPGNPLGITGLGDLDDSDLVLVVCAPEVPCGAYAAAAFDLADTALQPASFESNVKSVVTKVALGEADAGIVYRTDVIAAGGSVDGVAIPAGAGVVADYPVVRLSGAPNATGSLEFVEFLLGPVGRTALADHGFVVP